MPFPRHQEVNFWKVRVLRLGLNWERLGIGWGGGGGGVGGGGGGEVCMYVWHLLIALAVVVWWEVV